MWIKSVIIYKCLKLTFESSSRMDATKWWWKFVPCTWASRRKMMEVVVTVGELRCTKLQSNHHHQQTNIQLFTRQMSFLSPRTCSPQAHLGLFQSCLFDHWCNIHNSIILPVRSIVRQLISSCRHLIICEIYANINICEENVCSESCMTLLNVNINQTRGFSSMKADIPQDPNFAVRVFKMHWEVAFRLLIYRHHQITYVLSVIYNSTKCTNVFLSLCHCFIDHFPNGPGLAGIHSAFYWS